jgi:photosystem II stability/assembly factor-like uncharacterized protein
MRTAWAAFFAAVTLVAATMGYGAGVPATSATGGEVELRADAVVSEPWAWEAVTSWVSRRFDEDIVDIDFDGRIGLAVSVDGQVFVTRDAGATWELSFTTEEYGPELDLRACLAKDRVLVAGGYQGLLLSTDQGVTWRGPRVYVTQGDSDRPGVPFQVAQGADLANVYSLAADPMNPERMMASALDMASMWGFGGRSMVLVTNNGGRTWEDRLRGAGRDCPWPAVLRALRFQSGGRSLGCPYDRDAGFVLLSTDSGILWAPVPVAAREEVQPLCMESRGREVWVGDTEGAVWHSEDAGATWERRRPLRPPGSWGMRVYGIAFASRRLGVAVGRASWRTGTEGVVYRTTNGGESWTLDLRTQDFLPSCVTLCPDGERRFLVGGCAAGRPAIRGTGIPAGVLPYLDLPPAVAPRTAPAPGRVPLPRDRPNH